MRLRSLSSPLFSVRLAHVDEPKVLAIAKTLQHMGRFNALVREQVGEINVADRYASITRMFDSIREDSRTMIAQLDDGKIDLTEKMQNLWMKLLRGSPHKRFEKIVEVYNEVSKDTERQLESENAIIDGYIDFRFALKHAEILAHELLRTQETTLGNARQSLEEAASLLEGEDSGRSCEKV